MCHFSSPPLVLILDALGNEYAVLTADPPSPRLLPLPRQLLNPPTKNANLLINPLRLHTPLGPAHHSPTPGAPSNPEHLFNPSPRRSTALPPFLLFPLGCDYVSGTIVSVREGVAGIFGDFREYFESDLFGLCGGGKEGWKPTEGFVEKSCVGEGGGC